MKPEALPPDFYGCTLWPSVQANGYPTGSEHRRTYERAFGPVGADKYVDHQCRRRACTRLEHLEAVTKQENEKRKSHAYRMRMQLKCGHGDKGLRRTPEGGMVCRICCGLS